MPTHLPSRDSLPAFLEPLLPDPGLCSQREEQFHFWCCKDLCTAAGSFRSNHPLPRPTPRSPQLHLGSPQASPPGPSQNTQTPRPPSPSQRVSPLQLPRRDIPNSGSTSLAASSGTAAPALASTSTPTPTPTRKTCHEKQRGESLDVDGVGVDADARCVRCEAAHQKWRRKPVGPEPRCRVARDPMAFDSYKCGRCIGGKGSCSFSVDHPGIDVPPAIRERSRARERLKEIGRGRAERTSLAKAGQARANGEGSSGGTQPG